MTAIVLAVRGTLVNGFARLRGRSTAAQRRRQNSLERSHVMKAIADSVAVTS